jgi:hypothetical protein
MLLQSLISTLLVFILPVSAQFQFFDQMFNRQQPQQPQNAGSDSAWYQQRYEDGKNCLNATQVDPLVTNTNSSALRQVPLPTHSQLCALPAPLPLRIP